MELKGKYCPIIKAQCKLDKCAAFCKEKVYLTEGRPTTEEECCRLLIKEEDVEII